MNGRKDGWMDGQKIERESREVVYLEKANFQTKDPWHLTQQLLVVTYKSSW